VLEAALFNATEQAMNFALRIRELEREKDLAHQNIDPCKTTSLLLIPVEAESGSPVPRPSQSASQGLISTQSEGGSKDSTSQTTGPLDPTVANENDHVGQALKETPAQILEPGAVPPTSPSTARSALEAALERASEQATTFASRIHVLEGKLAATARRSAALPPPRMGTDFPVSSPFGFSAAVPIEALASDFGDNTQEGTTRSRRATTIGMGEWRPDMGGVVDGMWHAPQTKQSEFADLERALSMSDSRNAALVKDLSSLQEQLDAVRVANKTLRGGSVQDVLSASDGIPAVWGVMDTVRVEPPLSDFSSWDNGESPIVIA
jgi:hypothetical protein